METEDDDLLTCDKCGKKDTPDGFAYIGPKQYGMRPHDGTNGKLGANLLGMRKEGETMKHNEVRIDSDGTPQGTKILDIEGREFRGVSGIQFTVAGPFDVSRVDIRFCAVKMQAVGFCDQIEELAKELHEAGRAAVEQGATVAAEKFGEKTRTFMEWDDISETAKDGRRIQAKYLLHKYYIQRKQGKQ